MDRINGADTIDIGSGRRGFRGRNAVAGIAGTEVTADWLNGLQEEAMAVIEAVGFDPSSSDRDQLLRAIRSLCLNHVATVGGTANALTITLTPEPDSYDDVRVLWIIPKATNAAGPVTVEMGDLPPVSLKSDGADPAAGTLKLGVPAMLVRTGTGYSVPPPVVSIAIATLAEALAGADNAKMITAARLAAAVQQGQWNYATASAAGTPNALVLTFTPAPTSYDNLREICIVPIATNTGPVTINANAIGAVSLRMDGAELPAGTLNPGIPVKALRTATGYQIVATTGLGGVAVFSTAGTTSWTVPAGCYRAWVEVWGGGGGGSIYSSGYQAGEGGAGGGYQAGWVALVPGQTVAITIGAGGIGNASPGGNGGAGGTSSFGAFMSAVGGPGGNSSTANAPGFGGSGSGGSISMAGQDGGDGWPSNANAFAPGGDAGGPGGKGANCATPPRPGSWPGGGGLGFGSGSAGLVSDGAAGGVIIRY